MNAIRILFVPDTHLGFDLPFRPRVNRRRRGPDFFANFKEALLPALAGAVDCVVHGGDLFYRSKIPPQLVDMAFKPLLRVAQKGIPVYLVPGNHERSAIPQGLFTNHPNIHIFNRPRTYILEKGDFKLGLTGFPFVRENIRKQFPQILVQTGWRETAADARILCLHQCVEGATVGPRDYTFRYNPDVLMGSSIPGGFAAVLAGHIHRFQILKRDLQGRRLAAPVFYPGSIERTSFAEKDEKKGYLTLEIDSSGRLGGRLKQWCFHELRARPVVQVELNAADLSANGLESCIKENLASLKPDSIVQIRICGQPESGVLPVIRAESLRAMAPGTMNISAILV
jgi:DNA repair protein SbcD/Mre11